MSQFQMLKVPGVSCLVALALACVVWGTARQNDQNASISISFSGHDSRPSFRGPCFPRRIHLSQATDIHVTEDSYLVSMTVSFSMNYKKCENAVPFVFYGHSYFDENRATAERIHFNFTSSETGEYFESDWIYHVTLPRLHAAKEYWYRIHVQEPGAAADAWLWSTISRRRHLVGAADITPTMSFRTPPLPGSPTSIAVVGDLGQTENSTKTMAHIHRATAPTGSNPNPVSLVLIAGDMSYADSDPHRWTSWLDLMEPLFQRILLHVAAGNHEIECDNVTKIPWIQYENYFRVPNRISPPEVQPISAEYIEKHGDCSTPSEFVSHYNYGNSFYAFRHGLVQVIVLNSYAHVSVGSAQYKWFERTLQQVNRTVTPWLAVTFHAPIYNTFSHHVNETEELHMLKAAEPLFVKYNVNLVLSGHVHAYMRSHSVGLGGQVDKTGKSPVYIIIGTGGNREGHAVGYQNENPEEWVAKRDDQEYGYGKLFFANATHAHWSWVRLGTTKEGVHDHVWLTNAYAPDNDPFSSTYDKSKR